MTPRVEQFASDVGLRNDLDVAVVAKDDVEDTLVLLRIRDVRDRHLPISIVTNIEIYSFVEEEERKIMSYKF